MQQLATRQQSLEGVVTEQHKQHTAQVQGLQTQVVSQMEAQRSQMETLFESQMNRLEAILAKKGRYEWRCGTLGSLTRPKGNRQFWVTPALSRLWIFVLFFLGLCCRVGEAKTPGPLDLSADTSWSIGVCNPSGLLGKSTLLASLKSDIIAVSETHLTSVSRASLQANLRTTSPYRHLVSGAPLKPRTSAGHAGTYSGVAVIAQVPTRALGSDWPLDMYETGRVQVVGSFINHMWVTGGLLYGYPQGKTHANALERTNAFLEHLVDHMLTHATGPRYLCGDWNFEEHQLPPTKRLEAHGWQEVQQLEFLRSGQPPALTCKNATQKDFLWLSPELVSCFRCLRVDSETFPDHACLLAEFEMGKGFSKRYLWPMPKPVPWSSVAFAGNVLDFSNEDPTELYGVLWKSCEETAKSQLPHWQPAMGGRGQRLEPLVTSGWPTPPKIGRSQDFQPTFFGYDVQHSRWLKQLRRLHNFANWISACQTRSSPANLCHGFSLWTSILRAPGFCPSFQAWWSGRVFVGLGDPGFVPSTMPDAAFAWRLCEVFSGEVRLLEHQLKQNRISHKKWVHDMDPNAIFRETRRAPPELVTSLLDHKRSCVAEVDPTDVAVVLDPPCLFDDTRPVQIGATVVPIIHATDTKLYLASITGLDEGQKVCQTTPVGALDALFAAFREQWQQRWCRHDGIPHTHWNELVDFARKFVPHHPLSYVPIGPDLLRAEVGRKKKQSATGLDGVTRLDLLQADQHTLQSLCNMLDRATTDGLWPRQVISGRVSSLAKTVNAAEVNQYRPITVFSLVYRCFSSVTARALLDWADGWAHPDVFGNRKGHQTGHLWRTLAADIQAAHDQGLPLSGITADIEKCYNCLPRYPILAIALHCGVSFPVVAAWSGALAGMERRFKIRDSFSGTCTTSTGLAEGCALSCFGMLLLDDVLHRYVHAMNPAVRVLSFVDNWDFLTFNAQASTQQMDLLLQFAALADLTVDRQKTFGWSTDASIRGVFRRMMIPVKHHAKDLGSHVAFSKQRTNRSITDRLADLESLWDRLRRSTANHRSKVRALRTVAWPRGLFGIASAPIGKAIWLKCRRAATKALAASKPGVNPIVLLGLVDPMPTPSWLPWSGRWLRLGTSVTLDFGLLNSFLRLSVCSSVPRLHPQWFCLSAFKMWVWLWCLMGPCGIKSVLSNLGMLDLLNCPTGCSGLGTALSLLKSAIDQILQALNMLTRWPHGACWLHCRLTNRLCIVWGSPAVCSPAMLTAIGMVNLMRVPGVICLTPLSIGTLIAPTLLTFVAVWLLMWFAYGNSFHRPWPWGVGHFTRPRNAPGFPFWTLSHGIPLLWTCLLSKANGTTCSLMALVFGRLILRSVLRLGVRFWLPTCPLIGISVSVEFWVLDRCLEFAKRLTVPSCMPWPLSSTMRHKGASG